MLLLEQLSVCLGTMDRIGPNRPNWTKWTESNQMVWIGPKWSGCTKVDIMDRNGPKGPNRTEWTNVNLMDQKDWIWSNGLKWTEGPKWTKETVWPKWTEWTEVIRIEVKWTEPDQMDWIEPKWTEGTKKEQSALNWTKLDQSGCLLSLSLN